MFIKQRLLIVDGLPRAGKSSLPPIVECLQGMEQIQYWYGLERLLSAHAIGRLSATTLKDLALVELSERLYDLRLSRNTNFRPGDVTGVPRHIDHEIYKARLDAHDGDSVLDAIAREGRCVPFLLHNVTAQAASLIASGVPGDVVEIVRDPVATAMSWYHRGWGRRFSTDSRAFTFRVSHGATLVPWQVCGWEDEWLSMSEQDRCASVVSHLVALASTSRSLLSGRHLLTRFESWCQNPMAEFLRVQDFLKLETRIDPTIGLSRARFPREVETEQRLDATRSFLASLSPEQSDILIEARRRYREAESTT